MYPGPDALVVKPAEQEAADERARSRTQRPCSTRPTITSRADNRLALNVEGDRLDLSRRLPVDDGDEEAGLDPAGSPRRGPRDADEADLIEQAMPSPSGTTNTALIADCSAGQARAARLGAFLVGLPQKEAVTVLPQADPAEASAPRGSSARCQAPPSASRRTSWTCRVREAGHSPLPVEWIRPSRWVRQCRIRDVKLRRSWLSPSFSRCAPPLVNLLLAPLSIKRRTLLLTGHQEFAYPPNCSADRESTHVAEP